MQRDMDYAKGLLVHGEDFEQYIKLIERLINRCDAYHHARILELRFEKNHCKIDYDLTMMANEREAFEEAWRFLKEYLPELKIDFIYQTQCPLDDAKMINVKLLIDVAMENEFEFLKEKQESIYYD